MADPTALRESPLAHLAADLRAGGSPAVALRELGLTAMVSLRVDADSEAAGRLATALGAPLPEVCGATSTAGARTALWLGPDEWLVVAATDDSPALTARLQQAIATGRGSVVDVSANRTILELSGPRARAVLEKGCPADLHPRRFGPGTAITTTVGPVSLVLWQTAAERYRLLPRSSFADYLAHWLLDAMSEFADADADADAPADGSRCESAVPAAVRSGTMIAEV